jgi:hypothetical protein
MSALTPRRRTSSIILRKPIHTPDIGITVNQIETPRLSKEEIIQKLVLTTRSESKQNINVTASGVGTGGMSGSSSDKGKYSFAGMKQNKQQQLGRQSSTESLVKTSSNGITKRNNISSSSSNNSDNTKRSTITGVRRGASSSSVTTTSSNGSLNDTSLVTISSPIPQVKSNSSFTSPASSTVTTSGIMKRSSNPPSRNRRSTFRKPRAKTYCCDEVTNRFNFVKVFQLDIPDENMYPSSINGNGIENFNTKTVLFDEDDFNFLTSITNKVIEEEKREAEEFIRQEKLRRKQLVKRKAEQARAEAALKRLTKVSQPAAKTTEDTLIQAGSKGSLLDTLRSRSNSVVQNEEESIDEFEFETPDQGNLDRLMDMLNDIGNENKLSEEDQTVDEERRTYLLASSRSDGGLAQQISDFFGPKELYEDGMFYRKDASGRTQSIVEKEGARTLKRQNSDSNLLSEKHSFLSNQHNLFIDGLSKDFARSFGTMVIDTKLNMYKVRRLADKRAPMLKRHNSESDLFNLENHDEIITYSKKQTRKRKKRYRSDVIRQLDLERPASAVESRIKIKPLVLQRSISATNFIYRNIQKLRELSRSKKAYNNEIPEPIKRVVPPLEKGQSRSELPVNIMTLETEMATHRMRDRRFSESTIYHEIPNNGLGVWKLADEERHSAPLDVRSISPYGRRSDGQKRHYSVSPDYSLSMYQSDLMQGRQTRSPERLPMKEINLNPFDMIIGRASVSPPPIQSRPASSSGLISIRRNSHSSNGTRPSSRSGEGRWPSDNDDIRLLDNTISDRRSITPLTVNHVRPRTGKLYRGHKLLQPLLQSTPKTYIWNSSSNILKVAPIEDLHRSAKK